MGILVNRPLFVFLIVFAVWLGCVPILRFTLGGDDFTKSGQFGDTFGAVNALFSGLAFAGIVLTIAQQEKERTLRNESLAAEQRKAMSLRLYDEWHSSVVHRARIETTNIIERLKKEGKPVPTLSFFEKAQIDGSNLAATADEVFRVVHFFEKWAVLRQAGELDHGLLKLLLKSYVDWYKHALVRQLDSHQETNRDFVLVLEQLKSQVFE